MKLCIFGAGAIGGYLGGALAAEGSTDVTLIARGAHLAAMQANGLTLIRGDERSTSHPRCTANAAAAGAQDYLVITLKAHSVAAALPAMQPLIGPETTVVWAVNGAPWWYFHALEGPYADKRLASVDPGGALWSGIGPDRVIGCVVYPACEVIEPGVVRVIEGDRFSLGEPDGSRSERVTLLSQALIRAGLKAPVRSRIRDEIWVKLWGNLAFNPISALTGATLDVIATEPGTRALARAMMAEAQVIAEALGVRFAIGIDQRIDGAAAVGAHRTSMLQDLERGRPMEIDALIGAVHEMGVLTGTPTPMIDAVLALVRQRGRVAGCYQG